MANFAHSRVKWESAGLIVPSQLDDGHNGEFRWQLRSIGTTYKTLQQTLLFS
jgi:hypothetical protein